MLTPSGVFLINRESQFCTVSFVVVVQPKRRGPKRKLALFLGFLALATWSGQCFYGIGVATGAGVRFAPLPCACFGSQQQFQCVRKRQIPIVFFWFVSSAFMNKPFQHALHGHSWLGCVCAHDFNFSPDSLKILIPSNFFHL